MVRWLALLVAILASPAMAAQQSSDHPPSPKFADGLWIDNGMLALRWQVASDDCRDGDAVDINTVVACGDRDTYERLLKGRNLCVTSTQDWEPCKAK